MTRNKALANPMTAYGTMDAGAALQVNKAPWFRP